ncbi:MAG: hypothetical protein GTO53_06505 [Planctomycetales bacterium]|nr:hypothetical protein [Planctomycetales bacterium]NIO34564.1 hypothetical protein [Planctomycetales bacterium]
MTSQRSDLRRAIDGFLACQNTAAHAVYHDEGLVKTPNLVKLPGPRRLSRGQSQLFDTLTTPSPPPGPGSPMDALLAVR